MKRINAVIILALILMPFMAQGRKYSYNLKTPKPSKEEITEMEMERGSFMVASQCEDCNSGYRIDQIKFSGFDKPQSSGNETFFITNNTDRIMSGVNMYIEYFDESGRQLTKRFIRLSCDIPAGETRQAVIKSWDVQKSFYYEKSTSSRRGGSPFKVAIDPVAYYLRF